MFALLGDAVRADIDRQAGWVRAEIRRQLRHTALTGMLVSAAAFAALGAVAVGLIALHSWLAMQTGPFAAHGIIAGSLLLLALILVTLVLIRRRPRPTARPPLQAAQPAGLLGALGSGGYAEAIAGGEEALKLATGALRDGPRSTLLGTLVLAAMVGMIAGRKL